MKAADTASRRYIKDNNSLRKVAQDDDGVSFVMLKSGNMFTDCSLTSSPPDM